MPTLQQSYDKAAAKLREWFTRRIDEQSLDIARLYRVDRDRLIFRLRTIYEQYLQADPTYVRAKITGATHAIEQAIDEHVRTLARELDAKAVENLKGLMGTHSQAVRTFLKDELAGVQFQHLPYPAQNVLNELTTGVMGGGTFFDHMFHVTDGLKSKISSTVRAALVQGPERDSRGNIKGDWFGDMRAKLLKDFGVDKLREPKGPAYSSVKVYKNEARRQWNLLQRELGRRSGASLMWYTELDERSSPGCVARHGMLADELDDYPPRHFNCFVPETRVEGEFVAATKMLYDGPVIRIKTRQGYSLTVTPNHPILTDNGMRAAKLLRKGNNVISSRFYGKSLIDNEQNMPPTIEQEFESISASGSRHAAQRSDYDFDGDSKFGQSNIDIVALNGKLLSDYVIDLFERRRESALAFANSSQPQHMSVSALDLGLKRIALATSRRPSGASLTFNKLPTSFDSSPLNSFSVGTTPEWDMLLGEIASKRSTSDASFIADLFERFPFAVLLDEIVEIVNLHFRGHVYDLQSLRSGCIVANGIVASNCRCQLIPIEKGSDTTFYKAQASAWLQQEGYTRRQAQMMEAAFPWGSALLAPAMRAGVEGEAVPRLMLPMVATGFPPARVQNFPDSVLMRTVERQREVYTTEGWQPLKGKGKWCETQQGFFLDSPEIGPTWTPRKRRLPLDLINRWPKMRNITWAGLGENEVYAVKVMDQTEANAVSLGIMPEQEWLSGEDIGDLVKQTLATGILSVSPHPHLAVAIAPVDRQQRSSRPELATPIIKVEPDDIRNIVSLTTGAAIYARDNFEGGLLAPYQRVAVVCFEPNGQVWAIRPRGQFFWALPGGHIEKDEEAQDAARREMEEETGVKCTVVGHLGVLYRPWSTTQMFLARRDEPVGSPLLPEEIDAASAIPLENLDAAEQTWIKRRWANIQAARVFTSDRKGFEEAFKPRKLSASEVLYMVDGDVKRCDRCVLWRSHENRCAVIDPTVEVRAEQVCGLYVNGPPMTEQDAVQFADYAPDVVGLGEGNTACGNCVYGGGALCQHPSLEQFPIDNTGGCCNAHVRVGSSDAKMAEAFREDAFFDATKHPRGYHGKFTPSGSRKVASDVAAHIKARVPSPISIVNVNRVPEYTGEAKSIKTKFGSKKEGGDIGEAVVAAYIQQTDPSAHLVEPIGTWKAVDGISKNEAFDVKTGLVSVGQMGNRHWRFTFNTSAGEFDALAGKSADFKAKYNEQKMKDAVDRKVEAAKDVATILNRQISPAVWGVILNPDTQRADLYHIPGWHTRTAWGNVDEIRPFYVGTVKYKLPVGKKKSLAEAAVVVPRIKAVTWDDVPDWAVKSLADAGILNEASPQLAYEYARSVDSMYWDTFALLMQEFGDNEHGH